MLITRSKFGFNTTVIAPATCTENSDNSIQPQKSPQSVSTIKDQEQPGTNGNQLIEGRHMCSKIQNFQSKKRQKPNPPYHMCDFAPAKTHRDDLRWWSQREIREMMVWERGRKEIFAYNSRDAGIRSWQFVEIIDILQISLNSQARLEAAAAAAGFIIQRVK